MQLRIVRLLERSHLIGGHWYRMLRMLAIELVDGKA